MGLNKAFPMTFKPRGYSDSWDGMNSIPGGMSALTNLIPDPSTINSFQCRPAVVTTIDFATAGIFASPGFVSSAFQINNYVFGTVSTTRTAGFDEPFCYNILTGTFVVVAGITGLNVPTSPATTGAWTPPTATVMGPYVVFTHPGFNGANGYFGYFDITIPAAPVWASGNTTTNLLTAVPTAVALFYNRLYFAVANTLQYTDTLSFNRTAITQSLTAGDTTPITALSLFTLTTTQQGILSQGLLAFKQTGKGIFQVTGDPALTAFPLAINSLNTAAGTSAPSSVVPTPVGVFFAASDGMRLVQPDGTVSEPDEDMQVPIINAVTPSRISAGYNSDVYRICVQNAAVSGSPWQEYWHDLRRGIWTGPHTFQQDIALAYGAGFLLFSHINPAKMFTSQVTQVAGVSFTELGNPLSWIFATTPVGEVESMQLNCVNGSTLNMAFASGSPNVTCTASSESSGVLATATIINNTPTASLWGSILWGTFLWLGTQYGITPYFIPWTNPLVFTKVVFQATAMSSLGFRISNIRMLNQPIAMFPPA